MLEQRGRTSFASKTQGILRIYNQKVAHTKKPSELLAETRVQLINNDRKDFIKKS
jgi:hypothetical protein